MGLLDYQSAPFDPLTFGMGLLAASGPSRMPVSLGQALGAGYQSMQQGQDHKMRMAENQLAMAMQAQQIASMGTTNQLHAAQTQQALEALRKQKLLEDLASKYYVEPQSQGSAALGEGAQLGDVGPTATNAARIGGATASPGGFDMAGYLQEMQRIDPLGAQKLIQEARKANQVTLKDGEQVFENGKLIYGNAPKPDLTYHPGDGYRPDVVFDKRLGFVQAPGQAAGAPVGAQGMASGQPMPPQQAAPVGVTAPWAGMPAKQADEMKKSVYETENKKLDDLRTSVSKGQAISQDLQRFGELNRQTGTGGMLDRFGMVPTLSDDKREMEAISARLGPFMRAPGSGSSSDKDVALFMQGLPGVDKPGNVNRDIREQYAKTLDNSRKELAFKEAYLAQNGHLNGADQAWAAQSAVASKPAQQTAPISKANAQLELQRRRQADPALDAKMKAMGY